MNDITDGDIRSWWINIGGKLSSSKLEISEYDLFREIRKFIKIIRIAKELNEDVDDNIILDLMKKDIDKASRIAELKKRLRNSITNTECSSIKQNCIYNYIGNGDYEAGCKSGSFYDDTHEIPYMSYCPHCGKFIYISDKGE